jgi:uncharacterized protein (TIGR02246 family)
MVMINRRARATLLLIGAILLIALNPAAAQEQQEQSPDEAAIRQAVQSYVEAFNKGDASAVASHWSEDAEYVSPSGDRFKGRKKIEAFMKKFFSENKDLKIQTSLFAVRFPSADRAIETGTATVTRAGQSPEQSIYIAEYAKKDGMWKLTSVKEEEVSAGYEHLKDLEWLIGEWIDQDEEAMLDTTYKWSRNKSFITGSFTVFIGGKVDLQGTQVIGWDPVGKTIRSWVFDSQGGFGQGVWFKSGNQWIAESSSVLSRGEKASAMNIYTYVDDNTFTLQSIGRQVGGEPLPNIDEVVIVRKQPVERPSRTSRQTR